MRLLIARTKKWRRRIVVVATVTAGTVLLAAQDSAVAAVRLVRVLKWSWLVG